ncbi:hypothetical protein ENUP19_0284G0039 [Entamoeba nuttalli]|uniref:Uncharacterized protein n=2 Tax=Entamoeba nuttalli TaxID=412467 RepID=K2GHR2_ENTNP|nr:hypothetical protein ENU1_027300 [Entamoeba nuttalli P19]EKE42256.1 hypothetical protein ENU1_027300 [Entamoeba nuttalli P19]|eukprot:XP_008855409.1 hypothetical protein ENU1_027300 [Entamoeba nuttalli P19]
MEEREIEGNNDFFEDFSTILCIKCDNKHTEQWFIKYTIETIGVKPIGICSGCNGEYFVEFEDSKNCEIVINLLDNQEIKEVIFHVQKIPTPCPEEIKTLLIQLKDQCTYNQFIYLLKEAELGIGVRDIVDEAIRLYDKRAIEWCFQAIAFKELPKDHVKFLAKVLMTDDFTTISLKHFSTLQNQLLEINLTQPIQKSYNLHLLCTSLNHLIHQYLSHSFLLSSPLSSIYNQLRRMIALTYIPSFLASVSIPDELNSFSLTPLAAFLDDKNLGELKQFLVNVLQLPDAEEKVTEIPLFFTQEILPESTQQRILALLSIRKITPTTHQSVKEFTANTVVEYAIRADSGLVPLAEYLYDMECYVQSAIIAIHSLNKPNEDISRSTLIVSECIKRVKHIPALTMIIVKEIMSCGPNRDLILKYMIEDNTIDVTLGFRGIDSFISIYAPKLMWKVRILQGNIDASVKEIVHYSLSENDVYERLNEIRNCLGSIGKISETERSQLVQINDLLRCQCIIHQSLDELRTSLLQKSNSQENDTSVSQALQDVQTQLENTRMKVMTMTDLCIIASQFKLYDDVLVLYLHSSQKRPEIVQKLWDIVKFYLFRENDTNTRFVYFDKLKGKLGRFQSEVPQELSLNLQNYCETLN